MIVASGFVEADSLSNVVKVVKELKTRGIEINEINEKKIVFLIEKADLDNIKAGLNSLKKADCVRSVHLAYYSLE